MLLVSPGRRLHTARQLLRAVCKNVNIGWGYGKSIRKQHTFDTLHRTAKTSANNGADRIGFAAAAAAVAAVTVNSQRRFGATIVAADGHSGSYYERGIETGVDTIDRLTQSKSLAKRVGIGPGVKDSGVETTKRVDRPAFL
eukprot:SAG31_NODE_19315_length_606_cov_1.015779_2_plen_140_part_01